MAQKQNERDLVPEHGCVGQSHVPIWSAQLGLLCVREINFFILYAPAVFWLEQLSFTLAIQGFCPFVLFLS